jgi:hypothetical protein
MPGAERDADDNDQDQQRSQTELKSSPSHGRYCTGAQIAP